MMFTMKRIYLRNKGVLRFICTGEVRNFGKPGKKNSEVLNILLKEGPSCEEQKKKKILAYPEITISQEEKLRAKNNLKELLENIKVETELEKQNIENLTELKETVNMKSQQKKVKAQKTSKFTELALKAVEGVAEELGGDVTKTKQDLLSHLMTIEVSKEPDVSKKAQETSFQITSDPSTNWISTLNEVISMERLGIFQESSSFQPESEVKLSIWEKLEQEDLAYRSIKPVKNQFEEWARWTEKGLLWQFPIDNDQGREAEAVDFTEHMFLDEHLEPWCPKKGPLKKFMDLVLVGLSKNPYLSLNDKKEHILWYRDYFESKKQLLQELGAFGSPKEIGKSENAQGS